MKTFSQIRTKLNESKIEPGSLPTTAGSNKNILQNIRAATQTLKVKGVNPVLAAAAHRDFAKLVAANPHAAGHMLMRKLAPNKAKAITDLTSAGVPIGQALEANPVEFRSAISRIKRFK